MQSTPEASAQVAGLSLSVCHRNATAAPPDRRTTGTTPRGREGMSVAARALVKRGWRSWPRALVVMCSLAVATPLGPGEGASVAFATEHPPPYKGPLTVVLVAIDGVRWQEVFEGTDPKLLGPGKP